MDFGEVIKKLGKSFESTLGKSAPGKNINSKQMNSRRAFFWFVRNCVAHCTRFERKGEKREEHLREFIYIIYMYVRNSRFIRPTTTKFLAEINLLMFQEIWSKKSCYSVRVYSDLFVHRIYLSYWVHIFPNEYLNALNSFSEQ